MSNRGILPKLKNLLLGLALVATSSASGYELIKVNKDRTLKWKLDENGKRELRYYIDPKCPKNFEEIFVESAKKWTDVLDGRITFVPCKNTEEREVYITMLPLDYSKLAEASITPAEDESNPKTLYIKSSEIRFNENKKTTKLILIEDIMVHELGHLFGLHDIKNEDISNIKVPVDMVRDFPTMFPKPQTKFGVQSTLHLDDIDGLRKLYELPEWQNRTLEDIIYIEKARGKYKLYVSSDTIDDNLLWKFHGNNYRIGLDKAGLAIEKRFNKPEVYTHKRSEGGKRYKYLKVTLEWNGKIGEYEIPLKTLRKARKETISISPKTSDE